MHDRNPRNWQEAFAALPSESPPPDGWQQVSSRLPARRRTPAWMGVAAAAALVAIVVAPWQQGDKPRDANVGAAEAARESTAPSAAPTTAAPTTAAPTPGTTRLQDLYAESARLEALLSVARDDRVASGSAAMLSSELDARIAAIDATLARTDLADAERLQLWQARVETLRQAAGFESTQRLLASQGRSDAMLVSVD